MFALPIYRQDIERDRPWHHLPTTHILQQLETDAAHGLSMAAVIQRRAQFGSNALTQIKRRSLLKIGVEQFQNPLIYILVIAALITLLLQEWGDTIVISVVVILNALIGFVQEAKATRAMVQQQP
ncbi:MAG: cation-transporting P-type ATPase [Cyanobacteria bacterium J06639_14]